jgi:hypothetical protein
MSILTRLLNRLRMSRLESDLDDEVRFHLDKRADELGQTGLNREEAMKRAHEQFGDVDAAKKEMRRARLTSVTTLVTMTSLLAVIGVLWMSQARMDVPIPELPPAPILWDLDLDGPHRTPPPPPPPPPTREQCLEQAKRVPRVCG